MIPRKGFKHWQLLIKEWANSVESSPLGGGRARLPFVLSIALVFRFHGDYLVLVSHHTNHQRQVILGDIDSMTASFSPVGDSMGARDDKSASLSDLTASTCALDGLISFSDAGPSLAEAKPSCMSSGGYISFPCCLALFVLT